jgi:hypothetical protein
VTLAEVSVSVAKLTGPVATPGAPVVTNVASAPRVVPSELEATRRKWYVTPGARFSTAVATARIAVPDPAPREDVRDPYAVLFPYSKYHEVERPFEFNEPPSVADVGPTPAAAPVTTVGALWVVNVLSAPVTVPASLVATIRKW